MAALNDRSGGKLEELRLAVLKAHLDRFQQLLDEPSYRDLYAFCAGDGEAAA
ncbi:hypothetical protein AIOL_002511 [Candidatus Rhodobacter oscarellae]|uniref:Uncharacterized protein n=1 Tax=Candidatus Rhodobacter oscarellae TaxID=1675527 RepID=A0A0J9E408_9RHOB|nr:hypothetical protein [Candidatus Rhodobacter lobularis]KMW57546.1 hypothetical protein AIOL_002511 [Candidatus Rhodobacter lobularis]